MSSERHSLAATLAVLGRALGPACRRRGFLLVPLMLVLGVLEGASLGLILPLLNVLTQPQSVETNHALHIAYVWAGTPSVETFVIILAAILVGAIALKNGVAAYVIGRQAQFIWDSRRVLCTFLFRRYLYSDLIFHLSRHSSDVMRNLSISVDQIFGKFLLPLLTLATEAFVVAFIVALLLLTSPLLTFLALIVLGAAAGGYHLMNRRRISFWGAEMHATSAGALRVIAQCLGGIKEVKAFHKEPFFERQYEEELARNSVSLQRYQTVTQYPRLVFETFAAAAILLCLLIVVASGNPMQEALPLLGLVGMAALRLIPSMNRIVTQFANIRFALPAVDEILREIRFTAAHTPPAAPTDAEPMPFSQNVALDGVSFRYPDSAGPVLREISLTIRFGECVALVGRTGAGKTTIANMLLGLLRPSDGTLVVDGKPIAGADIASWSRNAAYIPQDVFLFDDTIRANIAFGVPHDEVDPERVREAVRFAQLEDAVAAMPSGLDTVIGERGARLSGGQRQRLGIARALYHDAKFLVMDEATSSLDTMTETEITTVLRGLHGRRTVVIIAHRLSTIRHCDCIFVLADGRLGDWGTFDALSARDPMFRELIEHSLVEMPA